MTPIEQRFYNVIHAVVGVPYSIHIDEEKMLLKRCMIVFNSETVNLSAELEVRNKQNVQLKEDNARFLSELKEYKANLDLNSKEMKQDMEEEIEEGEDTSTEL